MIHRHSYKYKQFNYAKNKYILKVKNILPLLNIYLFFKILIFLYLYDCR